MNPEKPDTLLICFRNGEDIEKFLDRFPKPLEKDQDGRFKIGNLKITWEHNLSQPQVRDVLYPTRPIRLRLRRA